MNLKNYFICPESAAHRQYEALRAFFVEGRPQAEVARQFGYSVNSLRVLCCKFRKDPARQFFVESHPGPGRKADAEEGQRRKIVGLRKQNLSVHDIADILKADGPGLSAPTIAAILKEEGFARLPRRRDDERPEKPGRPVAAAVADARSLDLSPRSFHTKFGGLFLFLPDLARMPFDSMVGAVGLPGSDMVPAPHAVRSVLALKLFGSARHTHVMSDVFDEGLGLFAGLNVIPKSSFLSQYSCRIDPAAHPVLVRQWFDAVRGLGYKHGSSFDLDFHTIPSSGDDPLQEKHYLSRRSRAQKGILAFVANDTENRAFCYVNADLRRKTQNDEIIRFVEFWKERTGKLPKELVFDSTFTTYDKLDLLDKMGIKFITLRRRGGKLLDQVNAIPGSAWRRIELENVSREYRTPRIAEQTVSLPKYTGRVRQIAVRDLGHEKPTIVITNYLQKSPAAIIQRYARRMLIENNIADAVGFFHMDALSSMVALKVNFDLTSTVLASTLYRMFAAKVGNGYESAEFARIFRDFIHAAAHVTIDRNNIVVRFQKRAHNPMLVKAGFDKADVRIPWLGNRRLRFQLG